MGRILVTGAAGFIGSHLVDRLLDLGYPVTGIDALTDYYPRKLKLRNLSGARARTWDGDFRFVEADVLEVDLDGLLGDVDRIAHLAGEPGVRASWGGGFDVYLERNVRSTQRLLEAAIRRGIDGFVYASSSSVYGPDGGHPVAEDAPRRPASPYGLSKLAGEELAGLYGRKLGVPVTVLRYFTVYGPRQRPEMALSRFISAAAEGRPVEVFGTGEQVREMTYVSDVVDATVAALESHGTNPDAFKKSPRVYNIGGGTRTTVNGMVEAVGRALDTSVSAFYGPPARGDVRSTWADTGRAARELGYTPRVALQEGIQAQARWALSESLGSSLASSTA